MNIYVRRDYKTVKSAVEAANDGDIIVIPSGIYKEKIFVRHINDMSGDFIGDCLLKDTKKAYILNLAKYLESRTNE